MVAPTEVDMLDILLQISWAQQQQEKYVESEQNYRLLHRMVSEPQELGEKWSKDPTTILDYLASVLKCQDNLSEEASTILWEVYTTRREELGPEHSISMKSLRFLAEHLEDQGKDEEAYQLFKRLRKLGHPNFNGGDNEDGRWEDSDVEEGPVEDGREVGGGEEDGDETSPRG